MRNRGRDALDPFVGSIGVGPGLNFGVTALDRWGTGLGTTSKIHAVGRFNRNITGRFTVLYEPSIFAEAYTALAGKETLFRRNYAKIKDETYKYAFQPKFMWYLYVDVWSAGTQEFIDKEEEFDEPRMFSLITFYHLMGLFPPRKVNPWGIDFSAALLLVEIRAGFSPVEFFDLLAGLAAFDPMGDDEPAPDPRSGYEKMLDEDGENFKRWQREREIEEEKEKRKAQGKGALDILFGEKDEDDEI